MAPLQLHTLEFGHDHNSSDGAVLNCEMNLGKGFISIYRNPDETYTIFWYPTGRNMGDSCTSWDDLDPITAQAILFELSGPLPPK